MRLRTGIAGLAALLGLAVSIALVWPGSGESAVPVTLRPVVGNLGDALGVVAPPGDPRLFIVQQSGRILILKNGRLLPTPFLNLAGRISSGTEQGLLGLAFHPDYARNGRFYVDYTNRAGNTRVVEYRGRPIPTARSRHRRRPSWPSTSPTRTTTAASWRSAPTASCTSGWATAAATATRSATARTRSLLGKLLRIDVDGDQRARPYRIPPDNPYAGGGGGRRRSTRSGCATRGASRSTARPATSGSATSARTVYEEVDFATPAPAHGARTSAGSASRGEAAPGTSR